MGREAILAWSTVTERLPEVEEYVSNTVRTDHFLDPLPAIVISEWSIYRLATVGTRTIATGLTYRWHMEIATFKFLYVCYYVPIRCTSNTCLQTYQDGQLNIVYTHKVHHHLLYV